MKQTENMLRLTRAGLRDAAGWNKIGVKTPSFDLEQMEENTRQAPVWLHFGAGNIFRAFIANIQHQLLEQGLEKSGIVAADTFDFEMIDRVYSQHDSLSLLVHLRPDGKADRKVVAGVAYGLRADTADKEQFEQLKKVICAPSLQMVSYTITEKGYALRDLQGKMLAPVEQDMQQGPENCRHAMSVTAALLWERFRTSGAPVAMVSMDNCSHNGEKLKSSVTEIARAWQEAGFVSEEFIRWLSDESCVSFPWTMIDKITPRPDKGIAQALEQEGVEGMEPFVTSRGSYTAAFVNAEVPQYLVVEDRFPNGRPALEKAGVYMADRDTVNNTERMKVTTCLNPLHTALAVFGCLLGYTSIAAEMQDADLKQLVERIGWQEGMPVVTDPGIIRPADFLTEVLTQRLPNAFIPDMPQRIATDTSLKLPIRYGETLKAYAADEKLDVASLTGIPLVIAGWCRYLLGVDDQLQKMEVSSDPMLPHLQAELEGVEPGYPQSAQGKLRAILHNEVLFGVDLYEIGLADRVETMFGEMLAGAGAVRSTLQKYLNEEK